MRARLLSALFVFGALCAAPAVAQAQGWAGPNGCHLGWSWGRNPPGYCCEPNWRWYIIRNRDYPNEYCQGFKGTLEPYNEEGLLLPPTSRYASVPVNEPTPAVPGVNTSRRPAQLRNESIPGRR